MTVTGASTEKLDIGRVIQIAIDTGRSKFARLATLWGITVGGIIVLVLAFALAAGGSILGEIISARTPSASTLLRLWPILALGFIVLIGFSAVMKAASLSVAISHMSGRGTTLEEDLRLGLRRALPLFLTSLLMGMAVAFGTLLLIVPGIMIALALSMSLSVVVFEKVGVLRAFVRSRDLTRNNRWRLLGLWAVVLLAYMVLSIVLAALTGGFGHNGGASPAALAVNLIESLLGSIAGYCLQAAVYAELRRIKDGVGAADLAAVFD